MQKNLALIAKYFKKIYKPTNNNLRTSSNTRNKNVDTTPRYKNDNQTGQFGNQRAVNVAGARETVGGQVVQQSGIQCFNCKEFGHFAKECRKPKRVKDSTYHKEKMLLCKQAEKGEVPNADSGTNAEPLEQDDQNDVECDDERVSLSKAIKESKLDVDELVKQSLLTKSHYEGLVKEKTKVITNLKLKEEKDIDKIISMENQLKFLNEIVYKRSQSIQTIHMLAPKCPTFNGRPTFANPMYIKKAQYEKPCLYAILHDQSDPVNRLIPDREEILTLEEENRSKLNKDLVKPFDYTKLNKLKQEMHADLKYVESLKDDIESDKAEFSNMYDMLLQECVSNDIMCSYLQSSSDLDEITELQCLYLHKVRECDCLAQKLSEQTEFEREQYFEIQDLKAQLQDKNICICELKKLIEKYKGKSVDTKFDKPSVVRQPNAQRIPKPSVLGKPTPFSDSLERTNFAKKKSVLKTNESEGLSKPVTLQNLPQTATQAVRNTNVIKPGMYRIASRVAHRTNVSRPQPRSNQMKDKVLPNTSQVKFKKTEVEDHPRILVILIKQSLKCVFNSNHDACVSKFLNDVNARTKKPHVVLVSTRKPKSQANKSVATPHKKTVALESTTKNSKSYYRMLYKKTSKAWK
ncbi:retrovirus-related pol polyprotein from transposon TNT 1-94 [Tanacetum coccineum]